MKKLLAILISKLKKQAINKYILFFSLLITVRLGAVIVNGVKLKHPETGKIVYLLGDIHLRSVSDQKQFKILNSFLKNNIESDIFIDGFKKYFQEKHNIVPSKVKKLVKLLHEKEKRSYIWRAKEVFKEIRNFAGKKIKHSDIQDNFFRLKIHNSFDIDYFSINNLLIRINLYCNMRKQSNIIPDIRISNREKNSILPQEILLQKNIIGIKEEDKKILLETFPVLKSLLDNYANQPVKSNSDLIQQNLSKQAKNHIDLLELDIVDHLGNQTEKPLIAMIGALHVAKLHSLLTSEAFGYHVEKLVNFDPNDINADNCSNILSRTMSTCIKELWKPFIDINKSYFEVKKATIAEFTRKLKQANQLFENSIIGLNADELKLFLE